MGRRRYQFDAEKTHRYLKAGRGQGKLQNYQPWLKVQDVPSLGRSHRVHGIKTQRPHHFLSDGEWKCFLMFESDEKVVDIREQFPLDTFQTLAAAEKLGVKHPYNSDGSLYVMTIDFLVTFAGRFGQYNVPYTFKYSYDNLSVRDLELIEIAKEFWRAHGTDMVVLTDAFFNEHQIANYQEIRAFHDISHLKFFHPEKVQKVWSSLKSVINAMACWHLDLIGACQKIAMEKELETSEVFSIVKHFLSRKLLTTDMSQPLSLRNFPISSIRLDKEGSWSSN